MYGAIRDQGKTVTLISGKKHILHDPNPEAMVIGEAIIEEWNARLSQEFGN